MIIFQRVIQNHHRLYNSRMITGIAFEQIQDNYWYGAYGEFRVVMMKDSGYINATRLCSSGGKNYYDWTRLKSSHELIQSFQRMVASENMHGTMASALLDTKSQICGSASPPCKIVLTPNQSGNDKLIAGTYIHPDLVPSVAGWVCSEFQIKANRVVNAYLSMQYKQQIAKAQQELEAKQIELEATTILRNIETRRVQRLLESGHEQDELIESLEATVEQKEGYIGKLSETVQEKERRHCIWSSTHAFTMFRTNNPLSSWPYYAIRGKRGYMRATIKRIRRKNPCSIIVYQHNNTTNPINLYNRLKSSGILHFNGNKCKLLVSEIELINKLGDLCTIVKPELAVCITKHFV